MKGEFSRSTFTKKAHYGSVVVQQGRVRQDADWNERVDLHLRDEQVYLEVWERDVEPVEDNSISDTGNPNGPDTTERDARLNGERPVLRLTREVRKGCTTSTIEATLGSVHGDGGESFILPALEITTGGSRWEQVSSFSGSGPQDRVYVVREEDDRSVIEFGDGMNGARPPVGLQVVASYRFGGGRSGTVP